MRARREAASSSRKWYRTSPWWTGTGKARSAPARTQAVLRFRTSGQRAPLGRAPSPITRRSCEAGAGPGTERTWPLCCPADGRPPSQSSWRLPSSCARRAAPRSPTLVLPMNKVQLRSAPHVDSAPGTQNPPRASGITSPSRGFYTLSETRSRQPAGSSPRGRVRRAARPGRLPTDSGDFASRRRRLRTWALAFHERAFRCRLGP